MSEGFIVDAWVGVAWAVHSQSSEATDRLWEEVAAGAPLVVPALWSFEVANSLLVLFRRKRILADERDRALDALGRLPLEVDDQGCRSAFAATSELAVKHGLSVYDATYLELAIRRKLPLASRDASLAKAARASRVESLL